jgi:hypothetical protein
VFHEVWDQLRRFLRLLRSHPSVVSYWLMLATITAGLAAVLALHRQMLMAALALSIAVYAIGFVAAVDRFGRGNLRNVIAVMRSLARFGRDRS